MLPTYFAYIGSVLSILGGLKYFFSVLRGKAKPNKITWFFWAAIPLIAFIAQIKSGVKHEAFFTLAFATPPVLVFTISLFKKEAYWQISRFDLIMGFLAAVGILLWRTTRNPVYAVVFSVLADASASVPTIYKAYKFQATEDWQAFIPSAIGSFLVLLTISQWHLENFLYPSYAFLLSIILVAAGLKEKIIDYPSGV